jgi:hypothetical protein
MPSFVFYKDGKITYKFSGVTKYLVSDFCRGLESTGMNLPPSCKREK